MKDISLQDIVTRTDLLQNGIWNIEENNSKNYMQIFKLNAELKEIKSIVSLSNSKLDKLILELEAIRRNGGTQDEKRCFFNVRKYLQLIFKEIQK